jgi:hypothetical protein
MELGKQLVDFDSVRTFSREGCLWAPWVQVRLKWTNKKQNLSEGGKERRLVDQNVKNGVRSIFRVGTVTSAKNLINQLAASDMASRRSGTSMCLLVPKYAYEIEDDLVRASADGLAHSCLSR